MFVAHCYLEGLAPTTVTTYVSALSYVFKLGDYNDVGQHFLIKKLLQGFTKSKKQDDVRLPITPSILQMLVNSLPHTQKSFFIKTMLKAMFLLAFHAFLRVGEMTKTGSKQSHFLLLRNINLIRDKQANLQNVEISIPHYKHSSGHSNTLLVSKNKWSPSLCPIAALDDYLTLRKHSNASDPLFSFFDSQPISRQFFSNQLNTSLKWSGLSLAKYKAHSFRIGAATTAATQGLSESQIQLMGRWNSGAFKKYIRVPMVRL